MLNDPTTTPPPMAPTNHSSPLLRQFLISFSVTAVSAVGIALAMIFQQEYPVLLLALPLIAALNIRFLGFYGAIGALLLQLLSVLAVAVYRDVQSGSEEFRQLVAICLVAWLTTLVLWLLMKRSVNEHQLLATIQANARRERDRFIALINTLDSAVITTDSHGKITLYNSASLSMLNTNVSLANQLFNEAFKITDANGKTIDVLEEVRSIKRTIQRNDGNIQVGRKDSLSLQIIASPITTNYGERGGGYVVILRDITKQKTLDDQRNEFISVTSHELRTPIAIIEGSLSSALLEPMKATMKPEAVKMLESAHKQALYLGQLIQDLATLARAEGEFLDIELQPISPQDIINRLKENNQEEARAKGINLVTRPVVDIRPVLTSTTYVQEILQNFVSNAIKYSKTGSITIGVENTTSNAVRFWVQDTGIGISVSDQKKLFTKFFQAEDFETREAGGTGLGLYITKKLAERIDGKVWCKSELEKGSTFFLEVPSIGALKKDSKKITEAEIEDFASAI